MQKQPSEHSSNSSHAANRNGEQTTETRKHQWLNDEICAEGLSAFIIRLVVSVFGVPVAFDWLPLWMEDTVMLNDILMGFS